MKNRNRIRFVKRLTSAVAVAFLAVSVGASGAMAAPDSDKSEKKVQATASGHKKLRPSDNLVTLASDQKDTRTGQTHACAGRKLIYQEHADPIYGTRNQQLEEGSQLTTMFVDGQDVVSLDSVCARLAPDASQGSRFFGYEQGEQISKIVVPKEPAYSFLGEPGQVLWYAPQQVDFDKRPIFAGIGAFDPTHELDGNVPKDFKNGQMNFDIVDFEGPGRLSIFFTHIDTPEEIISVGPGDTLGGELGSNKSFPRKVGSHGHYNWTFSEAGVYRIKIQPWADKTNGEREVGTPDELIWLVGTDEEVGLPEGTTVNLREVKKDPGPVGSNAGNSDGSQDSNDPSDGKGSDDKGSTDKEKNPKEKNPKDKSPVKPPSGNNGGNGTGKPKTPKTETPSKSTPPRPQNPPAKGSDGSEEIKTWWKGGEKPHIIRSGHMDLALLDNSNGRSAVLIDDENPANRTYRNSGTFAFALSDAATKKDLPQSWKEQLGNIPASGYYLPMSNVSINDAPWLGFSTEHVEYETLAEGQPVRLSIAEFTGPGSMITGHEPLGKAVVALDSRDLSAAYDYPNRSHDHQFFWFTQGGVYRVVFRYEWTEKDGSVKYQDLESYFLVGDHPLEKAEQDPKAEDNSVADIDPGSIKCAPGTQECSEPDRGSNNEGPGSPSRPNGPTRKPGKVVTGRDNGSQRPSQGGSKEAKDSKGTDSAQNGRNGSAAKSTGGNPSSIGKGSSGASSSSGNSAASSGASGTRVAGGGGGTPTKSAGRSADKSSTKAAAQPSTSKKKPPQPGTRMSSKSQGDSGQNYEAVEEDKGFFKRIGDMISSTGWLGGLLLGLGLMGILGGTLFFMSSRKSDGFDEWED